MQCNKCCHSIDRKKERYTICEGKCAQRYHAACVGLSDTTVAALFSKNILWMCDDCLADFCSTRDAHTEDQANNDCCSNQPSAMEKDIANLESKVAEIVQVLATIAPQSTFGRIHSTPNISTRNDILFDGTKNNESTVTNSYIALPIASPEECVDQNFSLYLTNIDYHTTENDVSRLVCDCLGLDSNVSPLNVKKLVPRGRANEELDFVSFKIAMNLKFKTLAMKPSTWPTGIKYREFENRRVVWRP